ncbi:MAG: endoflagellar protein [Candidatus Cloacimonadota bacterium]|nr:MAG: endoflagellar protein [Candidatus Cloacimonadota bacterium]
MIKLTKINGKELYINSDLMEFLESTPDTIVTLTTGKKIYVKESPEDIVTKIVNFKGRIFGNLNFNIGRK